MIYNQIKNLPLLLQDLKNLLYFRQFAQLNTIKSKD